LKFLIPILLLINCFSIAQDQKTRILFILDASNSMNASWGSQTRIEAAKELLEQAVDSLVGTENLEIALRVYGHQSPITATFQDCNDTKLEVPFGSNNFTQIKGFIRTIKAKGTTPIARSLEAAAGDFPDANSRNCIILITDGLEACDNDPCVIAKKLKDKNINITPFVIGIGMDLSYLEKFKCIGSYSEAETKDAFKNALKNVVSKALVNTTVQINLNDINFKPTETDVTLFLNKSGTNELKYAFEHTLNRYGNPDTLILEPTNEYDLVVNTLPKIEKKNIKLKKHIHNTIIVDAPQGFIKTRIVNGTRPVEVLTRITLPNNDQTINVQALNTTDKYLIGNYRLEILTLPRIYKTIEVKQSSITNIDIEAPGTFTCKSSNPTVGQVFYETLEGKWEWVCSINATKSQEDWSLQPGKYKVYYRQKNIKSTSYSFEKEFRIISEKQTSINL
jgi:Ca-activated chloride channel homolog